MPTRYKKKEMSTQPRQLSQKWFNGLEPHEIDEFEKRVLGAKDILEQLAKILEGKLVSNAKIRRDRSAYDKPAYSEFQADCNGYERALEEALSYLKITKET